MDQSAPFASRIGLTETLPSPGDLPAHQHRTVHRNFRPVSTLPTLGGPHAPSHRAQLRRRSGVGLGTVRRIGPVYERSIGAMGMGCLGHGLALHLLISTDCTHHPNAWADRYLHCVKIEHGVACGPVLGLRPAGRTDLEKRGGHRARHPRHCFGFVERGRTDGAARGSSLGRAAGHFCRQRMH